MNKALSVYIVLAALMLVVFAIWPGLDLAGAHYFYHGGGFFGRNELRAFWPRLFPRHALRRARRLCGLVARQASRGEAPLGAERPSDDLSHRHDDHRAGPHRQPRPQGPLASSPPDPDPGLQRAGPVRPVVRRQGRLQEELFVRFRRSRRPASGWSRRRACFPRPGALPRWSLPSPSGSARAS